MATWTPPNSGSVVDADFGNTQDYMQLLELEDICKLLPIYSDNSHKYSRGKLLTVAGSYGYTGACILAVQAANKTGAGIVTSAPD